jgi:hypothetical protein
LSFSSAQRSWPSWEWLKLCHCGRPSLPAGVAGGPMNPRSGAGSVDGRAPRRESRAPPPAVRRSFAADQSQALPL